MNNRLCEDFDIDCGVRQGDHICHPFDLVEDPLLHNRSNVFDIQMIY